MSKKGKVEMADHEKALADLETKVKASAARELKDVYSKLRTLEEEHSQGTDQMNKAFDDKLKRLSHGPRIDQHVGQNVLPHVGSSLCGALPRCLPSPAAGAQPHPEARIAGVRHPQRLASEQR